MRRACYPGSFDPPTVAHRAVARAALAGGADRVDLLLSESPLGKPGATPVSVRARRLEDLVAGEPRIGVVVTSARLLADVAEGYDLLVVGADKWHQLHDPAWYGSDEAMAEALARLPALLVVPRAGVPVPPAADLLAVDPELLEVSSTAVRAGRREWLWTPGRT